MEEWRIIDSNPDYQVSNTGLVRSIKFNRVRVLRPSLRSGYWHVILTANAVRTQHKVHRLVASAFIPNPDNKPQVDHINRIKTDNRVENLRWVTSSENNINTLDRTDHRNIYRHRDSYQVRIYRNNTCVFDKTYPTLAEAITSRDAFLITLGNGNVPGV